MREILLPFVYPPIINAYSGNASLSGILMHYPEAHQYVARRFVRLSYFPTESAVLFIDTAFEDGSQLFEDNAYLNKDRLCVKLNYDNVDDILYNQLLDGRYVSLCIDHYYVQNADRHKVNHFCHDNALIYGYRDGYFKVLDNFCGGKYTSLDIPGPIILHAHDSALRSVSGNPSIARNVSRSNIALLQYNANKTYSINNAEIASVLSDCMNGIGSNSANAQGYTVHSVECIKAIERSLFELYADSEYIDIRCFRVMRNHAAILQLLVRLLSEKCQLVTNLSLERKLDHLTSLYSTSENLMLKYAVTHNYAILLRVSENYQSAYSLETSILSSIISMLVG